MFLLLINYSACIIIMAKTENKVLLIIKLMVFVLHKKLVHHRLNIKCPLITITELLVHFNYYSHLHLYIQQMEFILFIKYEVDKIIQYYSV